MKLYVTVIMSVYQILHTNKMSEYKAIANSGAVGPFARSYRANDAEF